MEYRTKVYKIYRDPCTPMEREIEQRSRSLRKFIKQFLPSDRSSPILELGCGAGILLQFLHEAGYYDVAGVDILAPANTFHGANNYRLINDDIQTYIAACPSSSVKVVITYDVIEHLTKDELINLAEDIYRVLYPDGIWILHTVNSEGLFGPYIQWSDFTHEQSFTRTSLQQLFRVAGFDRYKYYEVKPVVSSLTGIVRRSLYEFIRFFLWLYWVAETGDYSRKCIFSRNMIAIAIK